MPYHWILSRSDRCLSHAIFLFHRPCKNNFPRKVTGLYKPRGSYTECICLRTVRFETICSSLNWLLIAKQSSLTNHHVNPSTFIFFSVCPVMSWYLIQDLLAVCHPVPKIHGCPFENLLRDIVEMHCFLT